MLGVSWWGVRATDSGREGNPNGFYVVALLNVPSACLEKKKTTMKMPAKMT